MIDEAPYSANPVEAARSRARAIDHCDNKIEAPALRVDVFFVGAEAHVNAWVDLCEPMQAWDQPAHR
ncbi:hypothetical protein V1294_006266 [Bradyrhizobium sp. AZCC 1678]